MAAKGLGCHVALASNVAAGLEGSTPVSSLSQRSAGECVVCCREVPPEGRGQPVQPGSVLSFFK